jgi:hypothetical protein
LKYKAKYLKAKKQTGGGPKEELINKIRDILLADSKLINRNVNTVDLQMVEITSLLNEYNLSNPTPPFENVNMAAPVTDTPGTDIKDCLDLIKKELKDKYKLDLSEIIELNNINNYKDLFKFIKTNKKII